MDAKSTEARKVAHLVPLRAYELALGQVILHLLTTRIHLLARRAVVLAQAAEREFVLLVVVLKRDANNRRWLTSFVLANFAVQETFAVLRVVANLLLAAKWAHSSTGG